jgi:hypothetical protein
MKDGLDPKLLDVSLLRTNYELAGSRPCRRDAQMPFFSKELCTKLLNLTKLLLLESSLHH